MTCILIIWAVVAATSIRAIYFNLPLIQRPYLSRRKKIVGSILFVLPWPFYLLMILRKVLIRAVIYPT